MTKTIRTHYSGKIPDEPGITPETLYEAAYLQGTMSNPNLIHDMEKATLQAARWADRMVERDRERLANDSQER